MALCAGEIDLWKKIAEGYKSNHLLQLDTMCNS